MSRLIDADALMPKLKFILEAENQIYRRESWGFTAKCINAVEDAPTIEERKVGKWIEDNTRMSGSYYVCDQCGSEYKTPDNFCGNCGAKMEEGEE